LDDCVARKKDNQTDQKLIKKELEMPQKKATDSEVDVASEKLRIAHIRELTTSMNVYKAAIALIGFGLMIFVFIALIHDRCCVKDYSPIPEPAKELQQEEIF